jgi:hypothetical protein
MSEDYLLRVGSSTDVTEITAKLFEAVTDAPGLPRLTAWLLLERENPLEMGSDPMAERWGSLWGDTFESRAHGWVVLMAIASWGIYREYLETIEPGLGDPRAGQAATIIGDRIRRLSQLK